MGHRWWVFPFQLASAQATITSVFRPVIRVKLLSGKLSQTTQTLHVAHATSRTFEREQWELLERRLSAWRTGLAGVLETLANSKKRPAPVAPAEAPEAQAEKAAEPSTPATPQAQVAA